MDRDYTEDFADTFRRLQRPLQRSLQGFRRRRVRNARFVGYTFTRTRGRASAGCEFGFALQPNVLPGIFDPPEAVAAVFVRPVSSRLHDALVSARASPVRRLVASGKDLGFPFDFRPDEEMAAVRHRSVARMPRELLLLAAGDFFVISLGPMRTADLPERIRKATQGPG